MTKRALITGINGFAGSHLAEHLLALGYAVHGTIRSFRSDLSNVAHLKDCVALHPCDLTDSLATQAVFDAVRPTHVFHLAAQSFVPASWAAPAATMDANVKGTLHVLEAARRYAGVRVQVAGTSEEYGQVEPHECPITEDQPLRPLSPYGVSKVAADLLAQQYAASYGLRVVVTRAFNHSGPRRGKVFAESDWARQIAAFETPDNVDNGRTLKLRHGNLDAIRDYTDVRDVVRGYVLACEGGRAGRVYNLCSGVAQSPTMHDVAWKLARRAHVSVELVPDEARLRPSDVPRLVGDATRASDELGWEPQISLDAMLTALLDYWRSALHATGPSTATP